MIINVGKYLKENIDFNSEKYDFQLPDITLDTEKIKAVMINEIVPPDPEDDFYGKNETPYYHTTVFPLFQKAGVSVKTIDDITSLGVYLTNAVKIPKTESAVPKDYIIDSLPFLEAETELFPNVEVIMLMGDVAIKAFNMISRKKTKSAALPAVSTYKLRKNELWYGKIRLFPSYIMTGKNILIEKSKFEMASEDIKNMMNIIR